MKEIEILYLTNCPYCKNARKAIEELLGKDPAFRDIQIRWIEENQEPDVAASRDYWYVPSIFYNGKKLYECEPGQDYGAIKAAVQKAFNIVLGR